VTECVVFLVTTTVDQVITLFPTSGPRVNGEEGLGAAVGGEMGLEGVSGNETQQVVTRQDWEQTLATRELERTGSIIW
jgi:hypothetical protein